MGYMNAGSAAKVGCLAVLLVSLGMAGPVRPALGKQVPQQPSQSQQSPMRPNPNLPVSPDEGPMDASMRARMEAQHARMLTDDRRKRLLADTDRLLALSTELKAEVDKTTKDEMSLDVIRKAGEIEKLAHDVKERMKN
jgi:hypothetical protein